MESTPLLSEVNMSCISSKNRKKIVQPLLLQYNTGHGEMIEIGIDEVGRGPLFGRLYCAAVVLPNDGSFSGKGVKDSKKFSSKKKMKEVSDYIKEKCQAYYIHYIEADVIDEINILQAVFRCMHECIRSILLKLQIAPPYNNVFIVVDGDKFKPYCVYDETSESIIEIPSVTIEKGDSLYMSIASASIIAKVAHDEYISELCKKYPELNTRYDLEKNVGYGTAKHLKGIEAYGISQWHRKTYKRCNEAIYSPIYTSSSTSSVSENT
jgi:ribonuclease HII